MIDGPFVVGKRIEGGGEVEEGKSRNTSNGVQDPLLYQWGASFVVFLGRVTDSFMFYLVIACDV